MTPELHFRLLNNLANKYNLSMEADSDDGDTMSDEDEQSDVELDGSDGGQLSSASESLDEYINDQQNEQIVGGSISTGTYISNANDLTTDSGRTTSMALTDGVEHGISRGREGGSRRSERELSPLMNSRRAAQASEAAARSSIEPGVGGRSFPMVLPMNHPLSVPPSFSGRDERPTHVFLPPGYTNAFSAMQAGFDIEVLRRQQGATADAVFVPHPRTRKSLFSRPPASAGVGTELEPFDLTDENTALAGANAFDDFFPIPHFGSSQSSSDPFPLPSDESIAEGDTTSQAGEPFIGLHHTAFMKLRQQVLKRTRVAEGYPQTASEFDAIIQEIIHNMLCVDPNVIDEDCSPQMTTALKNAEYTQLQLQAGAYWFLEKSKEAWERESNGAVGPAIFWKGHSKKGIKKHSSWKELFDANMENLKVNKACVKDWLTIPTVDRAIDNPAAAVKVKRQNSERNGEKTLKNKIGGGIVTTKTPSEVLHQPGIKAEDKEKLSVLKKRVDEKNAKPPSKRTLMRRRAKASWEAAEQAEGSARGPGLALGLSADWAKVLDDLDDIDAQEEARDDSEPADIQGCAADAGATGDMAEYAGARLTKRSSTTNLSDEVSQPPKRQRPDAHTRLNSTPDIALASQLLPAGEAASDMPKPKRARKPLTEAQKQAKRDREKKRRAEKKGIVSSVPSQHSSAPLSDSADTRIDTHGSQPDGPELALAAQNTPSSQTQILGDQPYQLASQGTAHVSQNSPVTHDAPAPGSERTTPRDPAQVRETQMQWHAQRKARRRLKYQAKIAAANQKIAELEADLKRKRRAFEESERRRVWLDGLGREEFRWAMEREMRRESDSDYVEGEQSEDEEDDEMADYYSNAVAGDQDEYSYAND